MIVKHIPKRPRVAHVPVAGTQAMVGMTTVQKPPTQFQLFEVDLLALMAKQLVDKHGGEDAHQDANH